MTVDQINEAARKQAVKHEAAAKARRVLDEAREAYGATEWDDEGVESDILDMVATEEE